eukprot:scaffold2324_cov116-Cylindrotheca_fusiformis.AAC.4
MSDTNLHSKQSVFGPESDSSSGGDIPDHPSPQQQENIPLDVARTEAIHVFRAKIFATIILLVAVCAVATFTYLLVDAQEKSNFESQASQF